MSHFYGSSQTYRQINIKSFNFHTSRQLNKLNKNKLLAGKRNYFDKNGVRSLRTILTEINDDNILTSTFKSKLYNYNIHLQMEERQKLLEEDKEREKNYYKNLFESYKNKDLNGKSNVTAHRKNRSVNDRDMSFVKKSERN